MKTIPLVRAAILLPFTDFLDQIGAPTEQLLERCHLSSVLLTDPERLIPMLPSSAFLETAACSEGIETFGLLVGQQMQPANLGEFGRLLNHSLTLFDFLITLERTINLLNSGERVQLLWQPDGVWLQSHLFAFNRGEASHAQCFSLMAHLNFLQFFLGPNWQPMSIRLAMAPSPAIRNQARFEGVPLQFNSAQNAIKIHKSRLSLPLQPAPSAYLLKSQADYDALHRSAPAPDFATSLQQLIQSLLPRGYPDITQAAQASGMSVRSLQRRLAVAEVSYSGLVEQVRFNLAMQWLQDPSLKLSEIAMELGYTESSNFSRAFKRWAGVCPREYRLTHYQS
ncbi:MAG: AraC family transcriptional regulator ligand-binding domain-containing protein [Nodosilinea sp.]